MYFSSNLNQQFLNILKCNKCQTTLFNFEPFISIPLDIITEKVPTITSMLRNFLKIQEHNGDWKCEKCNEYHSYTKTIKLWKLSGK